MATYKEIFGTNIEVLASDPANPVEGQVWYNSTSNVVKGAAATTSGAWATGGDLNTARSGLAGAGTQTAGLAFGGQPSTAITESYNGSAWTEVNDLNTARYTGAGFGTSTAAIYASGYNGTANVTNVESWDGTNWTEVADVNTARRGIPGGGTSTSGIVAAGTGGLANVETWNGTSWTETTDLNTPRASGQASATDSTAAIVYGGYNPGSSTTIASNELWNGSSWTEVNDLNTARSNTQGVGTATAALVSAGYKDTPAPAANISPAATELWNGTSWSTDTAQPTPVRNQGAGGTSSAAFYAGGYDGTTNIATTLEYVGAGSPLTVTFTDS